MIARSVAGFLLGLILAVGLTGIYALLAWPSFPAALTTGMLLVFPVWLAAWTAAYQARSAWRAWAWLGGLNLACYSLLWWGRAGQWLVVPA